MLFKLYNISCLYIIVLTNILIKLRVSLTITTIASIMIIAGFVTASDAFSSKNNDVPDECKCEKPDTLKVKFTAPNELPSTDLFKIEIYKKLDDRGNPDKLLGIPIDNVKSGDPLMIVASFGKDKLESNTAFVVYNNLEEVVAEMEIHTSCSKPLFITMTVFDVNDPNNGYSLEVTDGTIGGDTSIPEFEPNSCEDEKKKSTGTITVRKALTNDSGGEAKFEDFEIKVTNVNTNDDPFVLDPFEIEPGMFDYSINVKDVPAGTYTLSETVVQGYTTVLIAGDTGCPSMVNEEFTIKKNKNLSCTIYNDDDGTGDNGEIEPGNVFHVGTAKFDNESGDVVGSCDIEDLELPCMFVDGMRLINIVPALESGQVGISTLVLFSTVALGNDFDVDTGLWDTTVEDPNGLALCSFVGLGTLNDPNMLPSFKFECNNLSSASGEYRISYALIETLIPPNVL